jgi:phosphonate transport system substrate-binding protein
MHGRKAEFGHGRRLVSRALVLAGLLLLTAPAAGQEQPNPFGFLKPWLEKEILGRGSSTEPPPSEAPGEPTGALPEAAPSEAAPSPAATEPPSDAASAEEGASPPVGSDEDSVLRGSTGQPADALSEPESSLNEPSVGVAVEEPGSEPVIPPAAEAKPEPLRFALLAGRSAAATMALIGPIADDLARLLERPVELLPFPSYGGMVEAQVERRIDGGFYSSAAFALADARCACLEPLVAPRAWDGTLSYHAIIVARAGSGIASTAGLAGKTVAVGAEDSIGARRMQLAGLMAEGLDPAATFGSVVETESAEAAVRLVMVGGADAAFAWSSLAGRAEAGYSRGTLTDLVAAGALAMSDISIVWRSALIEHGPFALSRTLDEADKDKVEAYLVALVNTDPAAYDALNPFYGGGYAQVDPVDYSGIETLAAQDVDALHMPTATAASAGSLAQ